MSAINVAEVKAKKAAIEQKLLSELNKLFSNSRIGIYKRAYEGLEPRSLTLILRNPTLSAYLNSIKQNPVTAQHMTLRNLFIEYDEMAEAVRRSNANLLERGYANMTRDAVRRETQRLQASMQAASGAAGGAGRAAEANHVVDNGGFKYNNNGNNNGNNNNNGSSADNNFKLKPLTPKEIEIMIHAARRSETKRLQAMTLKETETKRLQAKTQFLRGPGVRATPRKSRNARRRKQRKTRSFRIDAY
jgi:hypothetical protein